MRGTVHLIGLGQILEKVSSKLGLEFLHSFSENLGFYRFLAVESIEKVNHREKFPVFPYSKLFQDGRHQVQPLEVVGLISYPMSSKSSLIN